MASLETIIIKFKTTGFPSGQKATEHLNKIAGEPYFTNVEQLFPGEAEKELASIYVATLTTTTKITELIEQLNKAPDIEYAHLPSERKGSI